METIGSQVTDKVMKKILRETAGLGTQATRANIIQTLFHRKFIQKEKKLLRATTLGFNLIDAVPNALKDPLLTAQWEQQLDDIAHSKGQDVNGFLQQQMTVLSNIITQIKSPNIKNNTNKHPQYKAGDNCPKCNNILEIRNAIKGKRIGQAYIGCNHYPSCLFYFWP